MPLKKLWFRKANHCRRVHFQWLVLYLVISALCLHTSGHFILNVDYYVHLHTYGTTVVLSSLKLHLTQAKSGFRSCPPQTNPPGHLSGLSYWIASLQVSPWIISCTQVIRPHFLDIVLYICYCSIFFSCVFNPGLLVGKLQKWTLLECLLVLNLSSPFCIVQDCLWREEFHPPSRCILPCQFVLSS